MRDLWSVTALTLVDEVWFVTLVGLVSPVMLDSPKLCSLGRLLVAVSMRCPVRARGRAADSAVLLGDGGDEGKWDLQPADGA